MPSFLIPRSTLLLVGVLIAGGCGPKSHTQGFQVTFSGETLGQKGLPFVPANSGDPYFVDGWNVTFSEYLLSIGNVRLTENATQNATLDPRPLGKMVAQKAGPYIVDIHKPLGLTGKDGAEPAQEIFTWTRRDDGKPFDTSIRYGFSYDVVPATSSATLVNLDPSQNADVQKMITFSWSKYLVGTATYAATGSHPTASIQAKLAALPQTVHFIFGWNDQAQNLDCINPDFGNDHDIGNRGIQPNTNGNVVAQITLHVDHLFWDKLTVEGTPLRFDPIAAWAAADTSTNPLDLSSLHHPLAATFADGTPLPDRAPYLNQPATYQSDQSNPDQVILDLQGVPSTTVKNLSDFIAFSAQSQMHLNANGICYIVGQHPSDPYYVPNL